MHQEIKRMTKELNSYQGGPTELSTLMSEAPAMYQVLLKS